MTYPKINSIFKRYTNTDNIPKCKKKGDFIDGEFSDPVFEYLYNNKWEFTEKLDGMNCRIIYKYPEWTIELKGKTDNAKIPAGLQEWFNKWKEENRVKLHNQFAGNENEIILYGEGIGPKIQKGKHSYEHYTVVLFDVYIDEWWLKKSDVSEIAKSLNLESVYNFGTYTLREVVETMKSESEQKTYHGTLEPVKMEGLVGTPLNGLKNRKGERIIVKCKWKDFK